MRGEVAARVILADDDEALRRVTARQLVNAGYEVREARDGEDALALADEEPPDLVVSDIMMPRRDGLSLCTEMRSRDSLKHAYIILLTAKDRSEDIVKGLEAGADEYITKPFSVPEFLARVRAGARLHALRKELEERNRQLEEALDKQAAFLGIAAHDIRAPLSIITTYLAFLGGDTISEEEIRSVCVRRAQGVMKLVDDLLNYSRVERGTVGFEPGDHELAQLLDEAVELFEPVAREKGISLSLGPCDPAIRCRCDPKRIAQILGNLLENALTHTEAGGEVRVSCALAEEGAVTVRVADNGCGIRPNDLERIFQPFPEVEAPSQSNPEHTGLGLAIVHKLVRLHDGEIAAESPGEGRGATFRVTLPLTPGTGGGFDTGIPADDADD